MQSHLHFGPGSHHVKSVDKPGIVISSVTEGSCDISKSRAQLNVSQASLLQLFLSTSPDRCTNGVSTLTAAQQQIDVHTAISKPSSLLADARLRIVAAVILDFQTDAPCPLLPIEGKIP